MFLTMVVVNIMCIASFPMDSAIEAKEQGDLSVDVPYVQNTDPAYSGVNMDDIRKRLGNDWLSDNSIEENVVLTRKHRQVLEAKVESNQRLRANARLQLEKTSGESAQMKLKEEITEFTERIGILKTRIAWLVVKAGPEASRNSQLMTTGEDIDNAYKNAMSVSDVAKSETYAEQSYETKLAAGFPRVLKANAFIQAESVESEFGAIRQVVPSVMGLKNDAAEVEKLIASKKISVRNTIIASAVVAGAYMLSALIRPIDD